MQNCSSSWNVFVLCAVALSSLPARGADGLRTVALWPSPGSDAQVSVRPQLNNDGQIAFSRPPFQTHWDHPEIDAADGVGIFVESSTNLQLRVAPGEQVPGASPGVRFRRLGSTTNLNDEGQLAFWSYLIGDGVDSSNDNGIFTGGLGELRLVVREGDAVPGHPELKFDYVETPKPALNDHGQVALVAKVTGPGFDSPANVWGVFSEGFGNGLRLVARNGTQVPGEDEGTLFKNMSDLQINNAGQTLFWSELRRNGSTNRDFGVFFEDSEASLHTLVRSGQQAPGAAPGVQFGFSYELALNENGQAAFKSNLVDPDATSVRSTSWNGIFRHSNGEIEPVAIPGQEVPGHTEIRFGDDFGRPVMNELGQTAFAGILSQTDGDDVDLSSAIFSEGGGESVRIVAQSGSSPVPGAEPGVGFAPWLQRNYAINNLGQVVFMSTLTGPGIDETNDSGIFVERLGAGIQLIARTGDQLDVSDDPTLSDPRTIRELGDKFWFDLNDAGEVAFSAEFTDGSYGVFVAQTVPEPATESTLLFGLLSFVLRKLRGPSSRASKLTSN